jgi:siroheme synthase
MNIADLVERERLLAPAVIVIGEVVRLRVELNWFGKNFSQEKQMEVAA